MTRYITLATALLFLFLSGCSSVPGLSSLNPFEKEEVKLPGTRVAVINYDDAPKIDSSTAQQPLQLPQATVNAAWTQPGGNPQNAPGHLSLSNSLKTLWSTNVGEGSSSDGHLTASPIVHDGKIYTLDTHGKVRALSATNGKEVWETSTTPESEKEDEGFGGGIAINNGRLFATTGYGQVVAMNANSGKILWKKYLRVPIRSLPTASGDKVFVFTTEGKLYCLSGIDGAELWTHRGLPENASLLSNASPAISGEIAIVPFASGEISAFNIESGEPLWSETLTRRRQGASFSSLSNAARPAISNDMIIAGSHTGKMIASKAQTGERVWTQNIASNQGPWIAGDNVFVVDVTGRLMALTKSTGKVRWVSQLPNDGNKKSRVGWSGPIVAGGKVWAISSKGLLVGANAVNGKLVTRKDFDTKVYIPPIVVSNRMYVYTDKAKLIALN
ncbi:MAG: PQQ-binding-like beta-propeller repeat protein [Pseudomonadota bacterium]